MTVLDTKLLIVQLGSRDCYHPRIEGRSSVNQPDFHEPGIQTRTIAFYFYFQIEIISKLYITIRNFDQVITFIRH